MRLTTTFACAALAATAACRGGGATATPTPEASPFANPPAEATALAALNSVDPEFAFTFDPQQQVAYFDRTSPDRSRMTIYQSEWFEGAWQPPVAVPWSGSYRDVDPFYHPEHDRLYFSSNRPTSGREPRADFDLWFVSRDGDGWTEPQRVGGELNDRRSIGFVSIARDGVMYFDASDDDGRHIYSANPTADGFGVPSRVALDLPAGATVGNPLIARDRSYLIHVIDDGPHGGADLMVTFRKSDDTWGPSEPLIGVNSEQNEFAPALSPDGRTLIFTSERPGVGPSPSVNGRPPGDLYQLALAVALPAR